MKKKIQSKLKAIQQKHKVKILYACESGSRAWGMASEDSDYDVRYIYIRDTNWYLSIEKGKDQLPTILEGDLDLVGWDLRKVLSHLYRSNASIHGWLQSSIIYFEENGFHKRLHQLGREYFQPKPVLNHFLGIAKSSLAKGDAGDFFHLKKYFYVLRPLLMALWTVKKIEMAPIHFDQLMTIIKDQPDVKREIEYLRRIRQNADQKGDRFE